MNLIITNLYAGSEWDTWRAIKDYKVDAVLDLRSNNNVSYLSNEEKLCSKNNVSYYYRPCEDDYPLTVEYLNEVTRLMRWNIDNRRKIFVHCSAGISRSSIIVCAYLIRYCNMSPEEAISFSLCKRKIFMPKKKTWLSLKDFSEQFCWLMWLKMKLFYLWKDIKIWWNEIINKKIVK
jgi:protein-tyrosine phosphatase